VSDISGKHTLLSCLCGIAAALYVTSAPAEQDGSTPESASAATVATSPSQDNWVDTGHRRVSESADDLAEWVDGFFGVAELEGNSASSFLRLRTQYGWDESNGSDLNLHLTGRLYLPQLDERVSLVFLGEEDDADEGAFDTQLDSESSGVGLAYRLRHQKKSQAYLFAGLKAGPKGKLGAKYRYQVPFGETNRFRISEEVFWVGGDGFGTLTRMSIDHALSENTLLRWSNRLEYSEESNGAEWNTSGAWIRKLDQESALRVFGFVRGESDPQLLKSRGFGVGYRRQFLRDWLHWELEPRYAWRKNRPDQEREGVAMVKLRLEITFGGR